MSSKPRPEPKLKAKVLNPKRARRKNFECSCCDIARYSAKDYKILFEARKIIYFHFPASSRKTYCHECMYKEIQSKMSKDEKHLKILVEDIDESYILSIERRGQ